jgi:hypothetical protein
LYTDYQMIFEKERERLGFAYWLPDDIWERERDRDFRFYILVTRWCLRNIERETFSFEYWLPDDIWKRERESLSVLYTCNQVMLERERVRDFRFYILVTRWYLRKRERETFGFVYWLPGDVWEKETEWLSVLYTDY